MLLALRQQQTEQLAFLYPTVRIFNLDKLIKVDMGHRLTLRYPLVFDFLKLTIVQDGRHVEPEVEFGILAGELDPEVTPDFLFSLVQVQNEVLLLLATSIRNRLPLAQLLDLRILTIFVDFICIETFNVLHVVKNRLNHVFFHIRNSKFKFCWSRIERAKTD